MFGFKRPPTGRLIVPLAELDKTARDRFGGKAAYLGELIHGGLPVPPGFVITPTACREFITSRQLGRPVAAQLAGLRPSDSATIQRRGIALQQLIGQQPVSAAIAAAVRSAYQELTGQPGSSPLVAVRSSVALPGDIAGRATSHSATLLDISGTDAVLSAIAHTWGALFAPAALADWVARGIDPLTVNLAVIVQRMINADRAGVLYTADPTTGDNSIMVIEAVYGLGDSLTGGQLTPDRSTIDKQTGAVIDQSVSRQRWQLVRSETEATGLAGTRHLAMPLDQQTAPKLSADQIKTLVELGRTIEHHFGGQQDIEWAIEGNTIWIVETRPVPVVTKTVPVSDGKEQGAMGKELKQPTDASFVSDTGLAPSSLRIAHSSTAPEPLVRGASASLGVASGIARIIHSPADFDRIKRGDVIVTELATLNLAPILAHAAALVTDTGGRTSHLAIAGHEHGIPVVVGTGTGTHVITDGQMITVDGTHGGVYAGKQEFGSKNPEFRANRQASGVRGHNSESGTQNSEFRPLDSLALRAPISTKIYAILSDPAQATAVAAQPVDGVGLLRAEFMIAGLGEHPAAMEAAGRGGEFTAKLAAELTKFAAAFAPRPVIYRTSDFKSNEYRDLKGGEAFEPHEENPMLGYRGVARYLAEPRLFRRELDAIKQVRLDHPNVWLMLPFVRTVAELQGAIKLIQDAGLDWQPRANSQLSVAGDQLVTNVQNTNGQLKPTNPSAIRPFDHSLEIGNWKLATSQSRMRLLMMCELPSNVILLDEFLDAGIDGVSIGSNDLTQLILGIDRDSEKLASEFDERDPAVMKAIEYVVKTCRKRHVPVGICGQGPSEHPDLTEKLIEWGITSLSVNPDSIESTRGLIASIEHHHSSRAPSQP